MSTLLDEARAFVGCDADEVRRRLGPDAEPTAGDDYGRLQGVTSFAGRPVLPGRLYLRDGRVVLVFVEGDDAPELTMDDLAAQLGPITAELSSRAGKQSTLVVHAEDGIAYSEQGGLIDYLEVFEPRSQADYEAEIYVDPGAFIR